MPVEAAGEKFTLPVVTRAAAAAGAAVMADVVASLLRLCSDEPVTAVVAVADALSKRHPTQVATTHTLLSRALQATAVPLHTPRVRPSRAMPLGTASVLTPPRAKAGTAAPPRALPPSGAAPAVPALNLAAALDGCVAAGEEREAAAPPAGSTTRRTPGVSGSQRTVAATTSLRTPRSVLKSESVVSYLARTTGGTATGSSTARSLTTTAPPATSRRSAPGVTSPTVTPSSVSARRNMPAASPRQPVDVDKWLNERRQREEERLKAKSTAAHRDARFIERVERQQEARNAALAAEEERRRAAAAAAAQWQVQAYTPLQGEVAALRRSTDATSEEAMLQRDAQRLFGPVAIAPQRTSGGARGRLLPDHPRETAASSAGGNRLADVVLKAAAAASLRSSLSDAGKTSRRGSLDLDRNSSVRGSLQGSLTASFEKRKSSTGGRTSDGGSSPAEAGPGRGPSSPPPQEEAVIFAPAPIAAAAEPEGE